jgi:hypothetical protein
MLFAFSLLGLMYFPSTVFILSASGAEGARRSWAFTWIGLSLLISVAVVWLVDWSERTSRWKRAGLRSVLMAGLAVVLVGGTASGLDASYRFPGPFLYGSDARSVTPELLATSAWFKARFGAENNIITDRYTGLVLASFGMQNTAFPSGKFPVYNLYLAEPGVPIEPSNLISEMTQAKITYLVVDERMAYELPELGVYFTPTDPPTLQPQNGKSVFYGRLAKFDTMQWMVKVFQSDDYSIYRLNLPIAPIGYRDKAPTSQGKRGRPRKVLQGRLSVTP